LLLVGSLLLTAGTAAAQTGQITGRVTEAKTSQPLAGATVTVLGTQLHATTAADGGYTISGVQPGSQRVSATLIGYGASETAVTVTAGQTATANIGLSAVVSMLDEVVVVGYGTQSRKDVTGSVTTVRKDRIEDVPATDVAQAIQGVVPGVSITSTGGGAEGSSTIRIRGQGSLRANSSPLVVVDGIPYSGDISEINQSDIASIDILKDASAAAIYGSRGSNGVILITTVKGSGPPRFSYRGSMGIQQISNVPELMTGPEFAQFNCVRENNGQPCTEAMVEAALTPSELAVYQSGQWVNWPDLAMRTGTRQDHGLSVSGGSGGTRYYINGSFLDVNGVARNDDFKRGTMRFNLDQELKSWLDVGTSTQLGWVDRSGIPASFFSSIQGGAYFMNPLTRAFEDNGDQMVTPWPDDPYWENPLEGLNAKNSDVSRRVFTSNYALVQLPIPGLSYRLNAGLNYADRAQSSYWGRNTRTGLNTLGRAQTTDTNNYDWTLENILRYERSFGDHDFDFTGLYSAQKTHYEQRGLRAESFPGDELTYWQSGVAGFMDPSSSFNESGMVSQMGRLNYSYKGRYLATLTARRDGASVFGENYKYGIFPSLALGWNISDEGFWPFQDAIPEMKLRASYGVNGNQAISPYATLARLSESSYVDGSSTAPGYIPTSLGNPDLRWERSATLNLGADFAAWDRRLSGKVDVYDKRTTDLLLDRLIPSTHGVTRITENMGELRNRGVELQLSSINVERGDFSWSTDFNLSANRNEIVDLYGTGENDIANSWFLGHPIAVNFGYLHDGVWQVDDDIASSAQPTAKPGDVRVKDVNGDGKISADDRMILSDRDPEYTFGLTNTLSRGNLSLSFFFLGVEGVMRNNPMLDLGQSWDGVRRNIPVIEYWTPENRSDFIPANRYDANNLNVGYYQDASFIRLKDATISYRIPDSVQDRFGVSNVRVYLSGRNLWTSTKWQGLDPELGEQWAIPLERTFVGGLNFSF
jgi:TonB-linked SusC/RagA family outer membrane protein